MLSEKAEYVLCHHWCKSMITSKPELPYNKSENNVFSPLDIIWQRLWPMRHYHFKAPAPPQLLSLTQPTFRPFNVHNNQRPIDSEAGVKHVSQSLPVVSAYLKKTFLNCNWKRSRIPVFGSYVVVLNEIRLSKYCGILQVGPWFFISDVGHVEITRGDVLIM